MKLVCYLLSRCTKLLFFSVNHKHLNSLPPTHTHKRSAFHRCTYQNRWQARPTRGDLGVLYLRGAFQHLKMTLSRVQGKWRRILHACHLYKFVSAANLFLWFLFPQAFRWQRKTGDSWHKGIQDFPHSIQFFSNSVSTREQSNQGWKESNTWVLVMFTGFGVFLFNKHNAPCLFSHLYSY